MRHLIFACALLCASLLGTAAEAGRGAAVVNYGDEIFDLGPLLPSKPDMRVGRHCQHLGLFWADVWTWDCRLVLANGDLTRYGDLPADAKTTLEALYASTKPNRGVWNQYGVFVMLGGIALSILLKAAKRAASEPASAGRPEPVSPMTSQPSAPAPARVAAAAGGGRTSFGRRGVA